MRIAIFPGSFDPITIGHESILKRALPLFDQIILAIGKNSTKRYYYTLEKRIEILEKCFENEPKIKIDTYSGLTIDYCKKIGANYIIRGLRSCTDFEYERTIAAMNQKIAPNIETLFLVSEPKYSAISSTVVREILINNGDISAFIPKKFPL